MSECHALRDRFPDLLVESLDGQERERAYRHIESCDACGREWASVRGTWERLGELPDLPLPESVRSAFHETIRELDAEQARRVVPIRFGGWQRRVGQAAAVLLVAGASYVVGMRSGSGTPSDLTEPAMLSAVQTIAPISEQMIVPAAQLRPGIQGNPDIRNVRVFNDSEEIGVTFDLTSSVTVTGRPEDESLIELISYVLQNGEGNPTHARSEVIQWVKETYSHSPAEPELVKALANVLRNDSHEGVRIKAVDALRSLPARSAEGARGALIDALRSDPNPAVRMKAVDALANLVANGGELDSAAVETLREKASQDDENLYVRVKAAEALSQISL